MTIIALFLLMIAGGAFHTSTGPRDFIVGALFLAAGVYILTLRGKRF